MSDLDARVSALCAAGRLEEAADVCGRAGEHARASELYERACSFGHAAESALAANDARSAVRLAALARDEALSARMIDAFVGGHDAAAVRLAAADLAARGHHLTSAVLYRRIGDLSEAAAAFERGGDAYEAAACHEALDHPAQAARVLEAALSEGGDDPDRLRAQLGQLYTRHGKHRAAVRVLQQLADDSPWRASSVGALARSLEALGYTHALQDLNLGDAPNLAPPEVRAVSETTLYGRYRVIREVATTPHARVHEAVDELSGERVAVKVLAARGPGGRDALARFVREAQALSQLRHPNVVPLKEYVAEGPALVLAWMGGGSLHELMDRGSLAPSRALEIARAVLSALAEAHRLGILHRDIKPSNLLFDDAGTPRLADFGAAHMSASEATVTAAEIGTVAYMSPEQRMGKPATVKSDVYAVGVLLHEMLTGELPQRGPMQLSAAHPDLGAAHDAVLARFLAERPDERYPSALEAREELEAIAWPTRVVARTRAPRPAPPPREEAHVGGRLVATTSDPYRRHDAWLGRDVLVLPLSDLGRAAAFARADHPALPMVLRVDSGANEVWIEAPVGEPVVPPLAARDVDRLRAALAALHRAGGSHGAVDARHLYRVGGDICLAWPHASVGDAASDDAALELISPA